MAPSLFGLELELGLAAQGPRGEALPPSLAAGELLRLAAARLAHLPDAFSKGIFSTSSIRIYGDTGSHPEVCTPECTDPWDAVRYTRAGERIVAALAARLPEACAAIARAFAFRTNVDYSGAKTSWGAHESYLHRSSPAALQRQVIPFLASRVVLCGAGGFDATQPGAVFTLSPRAPYIEHVASDSSTHDRGLYHTKDEPLARRGWHRLHVIAGESLGSDTALWLKVSTTALVVALAEAGVKPGDELDLSSPVEVLRAFGADVTCKASAPLKRGKRMTAVEIQRRYLAAAEAQLGEPILPAWAAEACAAWREALDLLETDPRALGGVLDWGIKLGLFRRHAERRGMAWDPDPARRPSRGRVPDPAFFQELFELDTRCGILGEQGLFPQLERAGAAVLSFPGVDGIERAMEEPPRTTRAKVRGECIRRLAGSAGRYVCDWQGILDLQEGRMLDLSDPFEAAERWKKLPDGRGPRSRLEREMELRLLLANAAAGREAADILDDAGDVADDEDEGDAGGGASSGGAPF